MTMSFLQALLLGLAQGLTEFLPVSSSGHLVILQKLLGFDKPPVAFDVLVHSGTLVAIVVFFWNDIKTINRRLLISIAVGTIPAAIIGLYANTRIEMLFGSLTIVAIALLVTSLFLGSTALLGEPRVVGKKALNPRRAFLIGIAQGLAIIPGISRSGITIVTGLWLGLKRQEAVKFSFLLSIPAISGAQILKIQDVILSNQMSHVTALLGFLTAGVSGFFALRFLKIVVEKDKLYRFAFYTLILAFWLLLS